MARLLQIALLGHPILRQKAKPVKNISDPMIQQLIDDLLATLMDVNGVGVAAPHVYQSRRLFVVASHPNPRYPNTPEMKPTPMINPKIISHSNEINSDWEGCLSVPGIRGKIPRFSQIKVEFTDRFGKIIQKSYQDFIARIIQHEYDHLDGLLFVDRVKNSRNFISDKEYLKLVAQKPHEKK